MKQAVYLIAVTNGCLNVLQTESGCVLPGGECVAGEPHEIFLMRHCMDLDGYVISVEDFVCEQRTETTVEYYYGGSLIEVISGQVHRFTELPVTQLQRLTSPTQRPAVEDCLLMMRADAHGSEDEGL